MSDSLTDEIVARLGSVLAERIDPVIAELRRQGRACVAAQAASEACAESVDALREHLVHEDAEGDHAETSDTPGCDIPRPEDIIRAIMPVADSFERVRKQANELVRKVPSPSWLARVMSPPAADRAAIRVLADGLDVLGAQLEDALLHMGVNIDRRVGIGVDGDAHRVVETRPSSSAQAGTVAEVIRPGYRLGNKLLREADVAVFVATVKS